jgi:hypothetical protein
MRTYTEWSFLSEDHTKLTNRIFDAGELLGVKNLCLPHQASTTEGQIFLVFPGQLSLGLQLLIHTLTDGAVSSVSSDNNVALEHLIVGKVDVSLVLVLGDVEDSFAEMDLVRWDELQHDVVVLGPGDNILPISSAEVSTN